MKTINELEKEGWQGIGDSLSISLFEYGIAHKFTDDGKNADFIVGSMVDPDTLCYTEFFYDSMSLSEVKELIREPWVRICNVMEFFGKRSLFSLRKYLRPYKYINLLDMLIMYHGNYNVFGGFPYPWENAYFTIDNK